MRRSAPPATEWSVRVVRDLDDVVAASLLHAVGARVPEVERFAAALNTAGRVASAGVHLRLAVRRGAHHGGVETERAETLFTNTWPLTSARSIHPAHGPLRTRRAPAERHRHGRSPRSNGEVVPRAAAPPPLATPPSTATAATIARAVTPRPCRGRRRRWRPHPRTTCSQSCPGSSTTGWMPRRLHPVHQLKPFRLATPGLEVHEQDAASVGLHRRASVSLCSACSTGGAQRVLRGSPLRRRDERDQAHDDRDDAMAERRRR